MNDQEVEDLATKFGCAVIPAWKLRGMYANLPVHLRLYCASIHEVEKE